MGFAARRGSELVVLLLAFAAVTALDVRYMEEGFLVESPPRAGSYFILRSALAFVLALFFVNGVFRYRDEASPLRSPQERSRTGELAVAGVIALALVAATLMTVDPELFSQLLREDAVVEWASAVVLFIASAVLMAISLALVLRGKGSRAGTVPAFFQSCVLFVIAMEEVSWLQRVLELPSPEWIKSTNLQGEFNLHNMYTDQIENLYYAGAFVLLTMLPFAINARRRGLIPPTLADFVPSRYIAAMGAMTTPFAYEMWNILWMQFSFFAGVLILFAYAIAADGDARRPDRVLFVTAALALIAIGVAVLATGSNLVRRWEDTEFKELLVALGLAAYAIEVAARIWRRRAASEPNSFPQETFVPAVTKR